MHDFSGSEYMYLILVNGQISNKMYPSAKKDLRHGLIVGLVYTKRQHQCFDDACDSVLIENS